MGSNVLTQQSENNNHVKRDGYDGDYFPATKSRLSFK